MAHSQALKSPYESKPALKKLEDNRKHNIIVVVHLMGKEKALFLCVCVCVCVCWVMIHSVSRGEPIKYI